MLGECGLRFINLGSDDEVVPLISPGYPSNYRNDLLCEWTVSAIAERKLLANVEHLDMEDGYDFLHLGNGERSSGAKSVIASMTGHVVKVRTVTSTVSQMWIKVAADRTGTATGFMLHLSQIEDTNGVCERLIRLPLILPLLWCYKMPSSLTYHLYICTLNSVMIINNNNRGFIEHF